MYPGQGPSIGPGRGGCSEAAPAGRVHSPAMSRVSVDAVRSAAPLADADAPTALEAEVGDSRRRFSVAVVVGAAVAAVPFLWTLLALWQGPNLLRTTVYEDNYYDLQARAMFHGHLWVPRGSLGIEGFIHAGREYTYFGLFPSLLRMPVLAVTHSLDGKLTPSSMIVAWVVTMVFTALLLWRVRLLVRGPVAMSIGEAASYGVVTASVGAGSVLLYLAATPYVFDEDLAWSVALSAAAFFALIGMLERPTTKRAVAAGLLVLAANLDRLTTGWAAVAGALALAAWFASGRAGAERRRWALPLVAVGLGPLAVGAVINWLKFGVLFGLPVTEQVWSHVNAHREAFLAAHGNSEVGLSFLPADALAYLRPDGIRFSTVFPFVTRPAAPAPTVAGVIFDRRYRTASITASMPLLFLLSCWGLATAWRRRRERPLLGLGLLQVAAGIAGGALLLWGYIDDRYLADYLPLFITAGAVGLAAAWRWAQGKARWARRLLVMAVAVLGAYQVVANAGIAAAPGEEWNPARALAFVQTQQAVSDITGHPLASRVVQGTSLPAWGPGGQIRVVGACDGLYLSDGEDYRTVPAQQHQRATWLPVELGPAYQHVVRVAFEPAAATGAPVQVPLVRAGTATISLIERPLGHGRLHLAFQMTASGVVTGGIDTTVTAGSVHDMTVVTDEADHTATLSMGPVTYLRAVLPGGPPTVSQALPSHGPQMAVTAPAARQPRPTLCRNLIAR